MSEEPTSQQRNKSLHVAADGNYGAGRLKIDMLLTAPLRAEYDRVLADPRTTIAKAHHWLAQHGVQVSLPTVTLHRKRFRLETDAMRRAARTASAYMSQATKAESENIGAVSLTLVEQMIMERLMILNTINNQAHSDENADAKELLEAIPDPKQLGELVKIVSSSIAARQKLLNMKSMLQAEQTGNGNSKGADVADRLREILGA